MTAVEVSGDLQHARVFVSALDPGADVSGAIRVLTRAAGFVRGELGRRRLGLKHLPELTFVPDRSIEHGSRIASLLRELPEEGEPGAEPRSTTDTREKDGAE